jgi:hypothetical protein
MKIRHLRIRINTDKGLHGTDIEFPNGLVILRADNTMGKSTCIQAILVALGFEAMLTTSQRDLPLPHAMKKQLFSNGINAIVLESDVYLEIENKDKKRIVIHRTIIGKRKSKLVTVIYGPALTEGGNYRSEDFFVSRPGSATRERGFHRFLESFLGWDLPEVQTYDGRQVPLYLQCIFPFIIVEQKRGWASLARPIPTQFRIKETHKRAVEFLLDLDAYTIAAKRNELSSREKEIEREWALTVREIQTLARANGGIIERLPKKPTTNWPPEIFPNILVPYEDTWITLEDSLKQQTLELKQLVEQELPRVNEITRSAEAELSKTQEELREKEVILSQFLNSLQMERGEVNSIQVRLGKLEEDIQHNKDVKILQSLGSSIAPNITQNLCPTCHQAIEDTLIPLSEEQNVMSIDDNIKFLKEQRHTFKAALRNVRTIVTAREQQIRKLREEITNERAKIRTLRQTLVSDGRLPSKEAIRERVELERSVERKREFLEQFYIELEGLEPLSQKWAEVQAEKANLPDDDTSKQDKEKIKLWNQLFQDQLIQYDFKSLRANRVVISKDTYMPNHEGFDLLSNISASDFIRIIWAYLVGLLEVSREFQVNHPGFLIFDEPKQQSTKEISFVELLERVSDSGAHNQQVIFATSENKKTLTKALENTPHTFLGFEGRIIRLLTS